MENLNLYGPVEDDSNHEAVADSLRRAKEAQDAYAQIAISDDERQANLIRFADGLFPES